MKAMPIRCSDNYKVPCLPEEATHVVLLCPGPIPNRMIPVMLKGSRAGTGNWTWNGDTEKPTLKPSVRTRYPKKGIVCHSWINDGKIQFLYDSTHELAGKTLDLLDVDEEFWS